MQESIVEQTDQVQLYVSPIADPIATLKLQSKIMKLTAGLQKEKKLKRGVKEVVKALRKGTTGICILAADVSPIDVISHIPIQCENKQIPYIYVRSRLELGQAAQTKKPTSVILLLNSDNAKRQKKYERLISSIKKQNSYLQ